jgi:hypothetical protein
VSGVKNLITESHEQVAEMHSMLAEYIRKLAKEPRLDIVRDYHVDLAQRLAGEATQIPRCAATLAHFQLKTSNLGTGEGRSQRSRMKQRGSMRKEV